MTYTQLQRIVKIHILKNKQTNIENLKLRKTHIQAHKYAKHISLQKNINTYHKTKILYTQTFNFKQNHKHNTRQKLNIHI